MTQPFLYEIKPDDYEKYAEMIMKDLDDFVYLHIQNETNMKKRQKNLAWLLNWIGKDCYDHLVHPTSTEKTKECKDRKDFIKEQYTKKEETKPFLDQKESGQYLKDHVKDPDGAFVSRLSSTVPGELTIQHYDDQTGEQKARRFNYKTQRSSQTGESIDDYLKNLLEKKNEYITKNNLQKQRPIYDKTKVEHYYSETKSPRKSPRKQKDEEISFEPYMTTEEPVEVKKTGIYLQPGEFTKRANREAKKYETSLLDQQFLKFKN